MIAALYVHPTGPYVGMAGVDPWTADRDATKYDGPWPVVAHPPCGHWGRYHQKAHDDGHTGPIAASQVRRWGGVLEHPRDSKLWRYCHMPRPWGLPDKWGGYTIAVDQYDWGHPAMKATWLYIVGCHTLPPRPRPRGRPACPPTPGDTRGILERLSRRQRSLTPPAFAQWLVAIAERCKKGKSALRP
jgi:hypothetical protein